MKTISKDTAKKYIYKTNGKIFSAVFTKKDGEKRKMVCRKERDLIGVFDMHKKAYRFINVKTLEQIKVKGITYKVKEK